MLNETDPLAATVRRELARQGIKPVNADHRAPGRDIATNRPTPTLAEVPRAADAAEVSAGLSAGMDRALSRLGLNKRAVTPPAGENAIARRIGENLAASGLASHSVPSESEAERQRARAQLLSCVRAASASAEASEAAAEPSAPPARTTPRAYDGPTSGLVAVAQAADPNWRRDD